MGTVFCQTEDQDSDTSSSQNPSTYGTAVTFTAAVTAAAGTPIRSQSR
jgi:hypothetical protein